MMQMNSSMNQKQNHRRCGCQGGGGGGGIKWEVGVSRRKLIYIGWINNKVLLYSTGNYIQYPMISHNGKEYKKNAYICTKSFCWTVFSFTINICFSIIKAISFLKKIDSLIFIFMVLVPECLLILYHFILFFFLNHVTYGKKMERLLTWLESGLKSLWIYFLTLPHWLPWK